MNKASLVAKAKAVEMKKRGRLRKHKFEDLWPVAKLWLEGNLTTKQVAVAMGYPPTSSGNCLYSMAVTLKDAYEKGLIEFKNKGR